MLGITLKTESLWINLKRWRRRGGGSWRWTSRTRRAGRGWRRSEQAGVQDAAGDGAGAGAVHLGGHPVRGDAVPVDGRRIVDVLAEQGIVPGIKVDKGLVPLAGSDPESLVPGA